jgi:hypothetical protein
MTVSENRKAHTRLAHCFFHNAERSVLNVVRVPAQKHVDLDGVK